VSRRGARTIVVRDVRDAPPLLHRARTVLNFNHLYYFHVVAAEGSVKAAAEQLGVTQPTVSEQVKLLERALGVALLRRVGGGIQLTDAGRQAFHYTSSMFDAGRRLVEALGPSSTSPPFALRIGIGSAVSRTVAADFLMPVLALEDCRPIVRGGDFDDLLRDLRAHELDLVIGDSEPIEAARTGLRLVTLHRPALVAITRPDHEPASDWSDASLLEYRQASALRWEIDAFLEKQGLKPKAVAELDDAFLMLEAVAAGGFIAFVPRSVAKDATVRGRVRALTTFRPQSAGIHAVFHDEEASQLVGRAVEGLTEHARTRFDGE
jgi:LysR family transcriptional activator of nhaA